MFDILIRIILSGASLGGLFLCLTPYVPQLNRFKPTAWDAASEGGYDQVFRVRIYYLGIFYYLITLLAAVSTERFLVLAAFLFSIGAVFLSIFLSFRLYTHLEKHPVLVYLLHILNLILFIAWIAIAATA